MVLEKSDLVERVLQLVENEKIMRERARQANEEEEAMFRESMREDEDEDEERDGHDQDEDRHYHPASADRKQEDETAHSSSSSPHLHASTSPPRPTSASGRSPPRKTPYTERNGLCVVCQDEEANIAIVDCGYVGTFSVSACYGRFQTTNLQTSSLVPRMLRPCDDLLSRMSPLPYEDCHRGAAVAYIQVIVLLSFLWMAVGYTALDLAILECCKANVLYRLPHRYRLNYMLQMGL